MEAAMRTARSLHLFHRLNKPHILVSRVPQVSQANFCSTHGENAKDQDPNILQLHRQSETKVQKISKAMKSYLDRAKAYDEFIQKEKNEFEIGKRHLANMMGVDADEMTQADVDRAIEYLMPSGLYEKKARPLMKPPEEVFPAEKAAQFDYTGRPFHYLFYTTRPNYYGLLHDAVSKLTELNRLENRMISKGVLQAAADQKENLDDSMWLSKKELEVRLLETLKDTQYDYFVKTFERLAEHPYSSHAREFILEYRKTRTSSLKEDVVPPLLYDETGRPYMKAQGFRKRTKAEVTVWGNGTGKLSINGHGIDYFREIRDREQVMFPLQFTGLLMKVDFEATVEKSNGFMCEAGAIRHALALALRSFVPIEEVERMRIAGLLSRDRRCRERKKPGQEGARRKYTWLKR
ncbi:28S ribosomal protein S9, mitochondrial isoform X2 [Ixodes scapularis]